MAAESVAAPGAPVVPGVPANVKVLDKGLKKNAIGFLSNVVIGVASTAPAYSLAATLGFIVADPGITTHAPGVLLAAFVPMVLVALGYRYLNRADPDAGTTFAWTTRAFGPGMGWLNAFTIPFHDLVVALLLGIFIYWGWDSGVAVNEESEDPNEGPGRSAVVSTLLLVAIYLFVSAGAQSFHGTAFIANEENAENILNALGKGVLGAVGVKFLIVAVLTSAAASTQTTILPTARTTLSMAIWGAIPSVIGKIHPRFLTPTVSTWGFGLISIAVAVPLILISSVVLELAVVALGIPVCFYYGTTGFACGWYYRRELPRSARKFLLVGVAPVLGGLMFYGIGIYA